MMPFKGVRKKTVVQHLSGKNALKTTNLQPSCSHMPFGVPADTPLHLNLADATFVKSWSTDFLYGAEKDVNGATMTFYYIH